MSSLTAQADRDRVLDATDLVVLVGESVVLKPRGREHVGLCPFHDDRSPSMAVVTHKGGSFYKCFACGAGGNAIDFVMNFHKMPFGEALRYLAARAGIELTYRADRDRDPSGLGKEDLVRANQLALKLYRRLLADETEGAVAREVIAARKIDPAMVEAFQLGYAPDRRDAIEQALARANAHRAATGKQPAGSATGQTAGRDAPPPIEAFIAAGVVREGRNGRSDLLRHRLVFPICDELGRPIAFGGRKIRDEDEPKYINSPESPLFHKSKSLYGIHLAKQSIVKSKVAIVTEGYTDVIACHAAGITNVVATLGTALTREHATMLRRLCDTVVLLFDGDTAGMRAADRGVEVFFSETIDVKVCTLPNGQDPDELLREPGGVERFRAAVDGSIDALAYMVRRFRNDYANRSGISGRQQALEALLRKLAELGFGGLAGVRKRFVLASLASMTGLSERELEEALPASKPSRAGLAAGVPTGPATGLRSRAGDSTSEGLAPNSGRDSAPNVASSPASSARDCSPARSKAERHLLALLLVSPELCRCTVEVSDPDGGEGTARVSLPLSEALSTSSFQVADHRDLYRTWHECVEGGQIPTFQLVFAELADHHVKSLASDLYRFGEQLREREDALADRSALDRLRSAFDDLERQDRRERFRTNTADEASRDSDLASTTSSSPPFLDILAAQERLRLLRERGTDVTRTPRPLRR